QTQGHVQDNVVALAAKIGVRLHADLDVQVRAVRTLPGQAHGLSVVDAGGQLEIDALIADLQADAFAEGRGQEGYRHLGRALRRGAGGGTPARAAGPAAGGGAAKTAEAAGIDAELAQDVGQVRRIDLLRKIARAAPVEG